MAGESSLIKALLENLKRSRPQILERAKSLGYNVENPYFHATKYDFNEFVPSKWRGASYFADTPDGAMRGWGAGGAEHPALAGPTGSGKLSGPNIMPVFIRGKTWGKDPMPEEWFPKHINYKDWRDIVDGRNKLNVEGLTPEELNILNWKRSEGFNTSYENGRQFDTYIPNLTEEEYKNFPREKELEMPLIRARVPVPESHGWEGLEGSEGKKYRDFYNNLGYPNWIVNDEAGRSVAVSDPKNIRSVFSAFNPEHSESADIMKSHGGSANSPAWTRKEGKNPEGGLNEKGRASLRAAGHDIKRPQPEGGSRKDSFCARMKGMKAKLTSSETANDPDSRINKSLRKWNCHADGGAVDVARRYRATGGPANDVSADDYLSAMGDLYQGQLGRDIDPVAQSFWLNQLMGGSSDISKMREALAATQEAKNYAAKVKSDVSYNPRLFNDPQSALAAMMWSEGNIYRSALSPEEAQKQLAGIGYTAINRANAKFKEVPGIDEPTNIVDQIYAPSQYSYFPSTRQKMAQEAFQDPETKQYYMNLANQLMSGQVQDPTEGAIWYYNPHKTDPDKIPVYAKPAGAKEGAYKIGGLGLDPSDINYHQFYGSSRYTPIAVSKYKIPGQGTDVAWMPPTDKVSASDSPLGIAGQGAGGNVAGAGTTILPPTITNPTPTPIPGGAQPWLPPGTNPSPGTLPYMPPGTTYDWAGVPSFLGGTGGFGGAGSYGGGGISSAGTGGGSVGSGGFSVGFGPGLKDGGAVDIARRYRADGGRFSLSPMERLQGYIGEKFGPREEWQDTLDQLKESGITSVNPKGQPYTEMVNKYLNMAGMPAVGKPFTYHRLNDLPQGSGQWLQRDANKWEYTNKNPASQGQNYPISKRDENIIDRYTRTGMGGATAWRDSGEPYDMPTTPRRSVNVPLNRTIPAASTRFMELPIKAQAGMQRPDFKSMFADTGITGKPFTQGNAPVAEDRVFPGAHTPSSAMMPWDQTNYARKNRIDPGHFPNLPQNEYTSQGSTSMRGHIFGTGDIDSKMVDPNEMRGKEKSELKDILDQMQSNEPSKSHGGAIDIARSYRKSGGPVWDKPRPKSLGKPEKLTPGEKSSAKAAAKAAGRPYPNLVDNMRAAREDGGRLSPFMEAKIEEIGDKELGKYGIGPNAPSSTKDELKAGPEQSTWESIASKAMGDRPSPERRRFVEGMGNITDVGHMGAYATPLAPYVGAADFARGVASGDPMEAALGATGLPGKGAKAVGVAASAMMPEEAKASPISKAMQILEHYRQSPKNYNSSDAMGVFHSLNQSRLPLLGKLGGIPSPSFAITKPQLAPTEFGDTLLVGRPHLAVPSEENIVHGSDMYSPRFPTLTRNAYHIGEKDRAMADELIGKYGNANKAFEYAHMMDPKDLPSGYDWHDIRGYLGNPDMFKKGAPSHYIVNPDDRHGTPATLQNIADYMHSQKLVGAEEGTEGTSGRLLANINKPITSFEELVKSRHRLPETKKEHYAGVEDLNQNLNALGGMLHQYQTDPARRDYSHYLSEAMNAKLERGPEAFSEYYKDIAKPHEYVPRSIEQTAREVKPDYFEAKPRRGIPFNEFAGAMVGDDRQGKMAAERLEEAGIPAFNIHTTDLDDPEKYGADIYKKFGEHLFQDGGAVSTTKKHRN